MSVFRRLCLVLLIGFLPAAAQAQQVLRIAAIVNDEVISAIDIGARLDLTILGMGQQPSPELARRLAPQIMRQLIDEKLQMQEAKARGVTIADAEIDAMIKDIEASNKMAPGTLTRMLAQNNVPLSTMQDQLRARAAWQRLIARKVRSTYQVSDEEVDEEIARLKENAGKPEYLVSDIFLTIDVNSDEQLVLGNARRLVDQVRGGANFAALARQFSEGTAAATSGDLGWVGPGQMEPAVEQALANMKPGDVSDPIRTLTGIHVLQLREKRAIAGPNPGKTLLKLSQVMLPLAPKADAAAVASQTQLAEQFGMVNTNCADFNEMAKMFGPGNGDMGNVTVGDLPAELRQAVASQPVGKATAPIRTPRGVTVLMVCARTDDEGDSNREAVRGQLMMARADGEARRYLRDLRALSNIDVRQ